MIAHRRRSRELGRALLLQQVDRLLLHLLAQEREVAVLLVREQLTQGARVQHGAGQIVLAELAGLLENRDLDLAEAAARLVVPLDEPRELDGPGEPGRACADEHDVHRDRVGVGLLVPDQRLGKGGLVAQRGDRVGHDGVFAAWWAGGSCNPADGSRSTARRENAGSEPFRPKLVSPPAPRSNAGNDGQPPRFRRRLRESRSPACRSSRARRRRSVDGAPRSCSTRA